MNVANTEQTAIDEFEQMEQEQDKEAIQMTIDQAQTHVRLGDALSRLQSNPDFQLLIMNDYLKEHTVRLGHLLSDPAMESKVHQKNVTKEIKAVGLFLNYLRTTGQRADMAREAIRVNEAEMAQMQ